MLTYQDLYNLKEWFNFDNAIYEITETRDDCYYKIPCYLSLHSTRVTVYFVTNDFTNIFFYWIRRDPTAIHITNDYLLSYIHNCYRKAVREIECAKLLSLRKISVMIPDEIEHEIKMYLQKPAVIRTELGQIHGY